MSQYSNTKGQSPNKLASSKVPTALDVSALLMRGFELHQKGELSKAKAFYDQVLIINPRNYDALHLAGVVAHQTQNHRLAVELIKQAIAVNPNNALPYINYGLALQALGHAKEALVSFDKALKIEPQDVEVYFNRGNVLQELKLEQQAIASYDQAIELRPDYADAHYARGLALHKLKRVEEARMSYERAIQLRPDFVGAYINLGNALQELKLPADALRCYERVIELTPNSADAFNNRGNALKELKRFEEALDSFARAMQLNPHNPEIHNNLGVSLKAMNRLEEALISFDRAIELNPDYADAYNNLGVALHDLSRIEEALVKYDVAIKLRPDYAEAYNNRGLAFADIKRFEDAIASYDQAIHLKPEYAQPHWNKSLAFLVNANFEMGWPLYEWRWKNEDSVTSQRQFPQPLWHGTEDLAGKTIFLHAEQGFGDTLQFCRYATQVKLKGARVVMEAPKALLGLLNELNGVDELVEKGAPLPIFDFHCPLLSLPLAFKTDLTSIPSPSAYLAATPEKLELWSSKLGAKTKRRVGLVWSGSTIHKIDHNRSMTLETLLPYLPTDFEYVSLQKEVRELDAKVLANSDIRHFGDELIDFTDTAALCELMDVVIAVDTSVAHLAAAIGKPTWMLLPYAPDWRWLQDRNDSPWYTSVRLYRQEAHRRWDTALERMSKDLKYFLHIN